MIERDMMEDLLVELGWDKGISLPVANKSNRNTLEKINELKKNVMLNKYEILSIKDKLVVIEDHKKTARQERSNCEDVLEALRNDIKTEEHLKKISERELGRLKQEIEKVNKHIVEVVKRKNRYENMNYTSSMELEEIKESMNWDQQDLEKYLAECNKQEDLAHYLNQYTRQDTSKAGVLTHQIAELIDVQNKARKALDEAVIETKILHVELDKSAEEYRKEHSARKEVIRMWQNTIEQMIKRDKDLLRAENDLNDYKDKVRTLTLEVAERKRLCDGIMEDNFNYEKQLNQSDKDIAKYKELYGDILKEIEKLRREFELLKTTIDRTGRECEVNRAVIRQMQIQREVLNVRGNQLRDQTENFAEKLDMVIDGRIESEKLMAFAEDHLREEEMYILKLNEEMGKMREKQYKLCLELSAEQNHKKNSESEVMTFRANLRNLISRKAKCEADLLRLDELIYKTDLNIQSLEHRLAILEGDNTSAVMQTELQNRIVYLTEELENNQKSTKQLTDMINRFLNESRIHRMNIEKLKVLKVEEDDKIVAEEISIENAQLSLKKARKLREDTLVYRNLENFQLNKLKVICESNINSVTNLEIKKEGLTAIVNERRVEIDCFKDILRKEIRQLEIDKTDIHRQLSSVEQKLEKSSARYHVVSNVNQDYNLGGTKAVIEAALEKEHVQTFGDNLDHKIRKTEKEIRALENTVVLLNTCNDSYRYLYTKTNQNSTEQLQKNQAEASLKAELKMNSLKRCEVRMLLKEVEKSNEDLVMYKIEFDETIRKIDEIKDKILRKTNDIQKMKDKIERADNAKGMALGSVSEDTANVVDIKIRVNNYIAGVHVMEAMQILVKKYPLIWDESARGYFETSLFEIPHQWRSSNLNNANSQRSISNVNNTRSSSRTIPVSVINLGSNVTCDSNYLPATARSLNSSSNGSSTRSSVKLKLQNQGLEPFSSQK